MLNVSTAVSSRAIPSIVAPALNPASPARTADARTAASHAAHPVSQGVGVSLDGRNMKDLERVVQSLHPSMLEGIKTGERGLSWSGDGDAVSRATREAPLSMLDSVYEWCGDTLRQFLGGPAENEPQAWSGEPDSVRMGPAREQAGAPEARMKRSASGADVLKFEDVISQVKPRSQLPRILDPRMKVGGTLEVDLRRLEPRPQQSRSSAAGGALEAALRQFDVFPQRSPVPGAHKNNHRPVDFLTQRGSLAYPRRCNTVDRGDPIAHLLIPEHINPSLCPQLKHTVSSPRISAKSVTEGAQRTLQGAQGVLSRVRVWLPPEKAATLTVKVTREGATPGHRTWNRHTGTDGVVVRVLSGDAGNPVPNIENCQPTGPRNGTQVCSIPFQHGFIDGMRFVTVEVFTASAGKPVLLEVASLRPA